MNLKIISIENKNQLNDFIAKQPQNEFLQSFEWGEFQTKTGNKIFRLGVTSDGEELIAAVTIIKKSLPLGKSYFYAPRGPVFNEELRMKNEELINDFLFTEIKKIGEKEGAIFFRFEPSSVIPDVAKRRSGMTSLQRTNDIQPSQTIILNLENTEENILKNMHSKTRYNIRLAAKKGVSALEATPDDFDEFWQLMQETCARDGFRLHTKEHYQKMLKEPNNKLFLTKLDNQIITAAIIHFFGNTATYLHGASANIHRNVMAPFLLQWYVIQLARKLEYKYYDFYGIDETKWPGVTRFKKGFAGDEINYPGTFDLIINKHLYFAYCSVRKIKKILKKIIKKQ